MDTSVGRIGVVTLPIFAGDLYSDPERLLELVRAGLELTAKAGARVVSLTGLIPSATEYGMATRPLVEGRSDLPSITTGHATTVAAVVLATAKALRSAGRTMEQERLGVLGLGSIGLSTLELILRCLPHPNEILLCDVYDKQELLAEVQKRVKALGFGGTVRVLHSKADVPPEFYESTLIVGATNVPEILDVARVGPGTILVDDSGPHCFNVRDAVQRFRTREDLLFTAGGVLTSPASIRLLRWLPRSVEGRVTGSRRKKRRRQRQNRDAVPGNELGERRPVLLGPGGRDEQLGTAPERPGKSPSGRE
ncbi:MAG TPA: hypothetical protein VNO43_00225 [Candidatus Eisenbacteria bacterium]|nr:hypothetical protein [Candidatus Eisenbacteria bacterium]